MVKRIAIVLALTWSIALPSTFAADQRPTEASINQLLEVIQVRKFLESTMAQMDALMKQATQQVTQGQKITPEVKSRSTRDKPRPFR